MLELSRINKESLKMLPHRKEHEDEAEYFYDEVVDDPFGEDDHEYYPEGEDEQ